MTTNPPPNVDIEAIMQQIRRQILEDRAQATPSAHVITPAAGDRLPSEFYEHLYQAELAYNQIGVKMHVTKVSLPVIGPLIERLRQKVHELVLFYVNQVAAQQIKVNTHLLHAVSILAQELEREASERDSDQHDGGQRDATPHDG
jgi:hypothetical protein